MFKALALAKSKLMELIKSFGLFLRKTVCNMHIYDTFRETALKTLVFIISFSVSVLCYYKVDSVASDPLQTNIAFGGSIIIYGLSLIAEVFMMLDPLKSFSKKLFVGIIASDGVAAIVLGLIQIYATGISIPVEYIIFTCAISVAIYIVDLALFYWVRPPEVHLGGQENTVINMDVGG